MGVGEIMGKYRRVPLTGGSSKGVFTGLMKETIDGLTCENTFNSSRQLSSPCQYVLMFLIRYNVDRSISLRYCLMDS